MRLIDALAVHRVEVIAVPEVQAANNRLGAGLRVLLAEPGLDRILVINVEHFVNDLHEVVDLGLAVLHQIVFQREQPHKGDGGDAKHGDGDHRQQLYRHPNVGEHDDPEPVRGKGSSLRVMKNWYGRGARSDDRYY